MLKIGCFISMFCLYHLIKANSTLRCLDNEIQVDCPVESPSDCCPASSEDNQKYPTPKVCPPPQCKCRFNYRRACNGTCIPTRDCPPFECPENEVYNPCPALCPTDSCNDRGLNGKCPFRIGTVLQCNPKCVCQEGFYRNDCGNCVPAEDCC